MVQSSCRVGVPKMLVFLRFYEHRVIAEMEPGVLPVAPARRRLAVPPRDLDGMTKGHCTG